MCVGNRGWHPRTFLIRMPPGRQRSVSGRLGIQSGRQQGSDSSLLPQEVHGQHHPGRWPAEARGPGRHEFILPSLEYGIGGFRDPKFSGWKEAA